MESIVQAGKRIEIEPGLRTLILIELILPIILLIFGIYHGLMQELYRAGIIRATSVLGIGYYQGLTAHGVINAIVFTTFFAVAFGHGIVRYYTNKPLHMGAAWLSCIFMIVGAVLAALMIFSGKASVLYTFYPPLKAHPLFYIGLVIFVIGSWLGWGSWYPPILAWTRENPGEKIPLAVMGMHSTFIVWFIATIPVAVEILFLLLPWSLGWTQTVNVPLARMLFWFFGHALVYFWLLPAYVMYYTMLPKLCGGKLYSDFAGRFTFLWFILFSAPVGLHHQFTEPGINSSWKYLHAFFTVLVAIPSLAHRFHARRKHGARGEGTRGQRNFLLVGMATLSGS